MSHICVIFVSGIRLKQGVEQALQSAGIEDRNLVKRMAGYLLDSKSDNTTKKYYYSFKKWKDFCIAKNFKVLPAQHIHVAIYITHLLDSSCSVHTISAAVYSIKWAHGISGLDDPTDNSFVKNLLESAKRLRGGKTIKKDVLTSDTIVELCDKFLGSGDLLVVRDLSMITLAFAGFLRYDELSSIECKDVSFFSDYIRIVIAKSKTDQYRAGNEILISKGHSSACPVNLLSRYMELASLSTVSEGFLYRPLFRSGSVCRLIYKNKRLSYTRARQCLLDKLRIVAPDLNLGLHSLRASGCTKAANANVNERCLKRHGRWRRDESRDGYVADSVEKRLEITKKLGL